METFENASIEKESRLWGMLCHLSALSMFIGIPFGNVLGPLVIWLIKKDEFPFVNEQGKESLNFQISMTIYGFISIVLILLAVGILLIIFIVLADLVLVIIASVQTNDGKSYRYPMTIRFVK
ncbi:MAG: DUF4870 domain-containing protein [Ignavibacteriales bacterium]